MSKVVEGLTVRTARNGLNYFPHFRRLEVEGGTLWLLNERGERTYSREWSEVREIAFQTMQWDGGRSWLSRAGFDEGSLPKADSGGLTRPGGAGDDSALGQLAERLRKCEVLLMRALEELCLVGLKDSYDVGLRAEIRAVLTDATPPNRVSTDVEPLDSAGGKQA